MGVANTLRSKVAGFIAPKSSNSMGQELADQFFRYGNQKRLPADWSSLSVSDRDLYTGYVYGAIHKRANRAAQLAQESIATRAEKKVAEQAKAKDVEIVHPYLTKIDESPSFSNYKFWYDISTYLDIEGVYYLMVERNKAGARVGNIQNFRLLNPYNVTRVINEETLEVGAYIERRKGLIRTIPKHMIIEMRELNPFDEDEPFATIDAAKDNQFTLKQAGDYTRHALKNNSSAPGIISTDVVLDPEKFANFMSHVKSSEKGAPLFGNGSGAIDYKSMQIDMDKAALDKIHAINLDGLIAATGASKTILGIEQSGTTRDTARVQGDLFITGSVMPRLQMIFDALNQDYKVNYPLEYQKTKYEIYVDSPLGTDRDAESKDIDIRDSSYNLYVTLVNEGYDRDLAARYAAGEILLEDLGEPTNPPKTDPLALDPTRVTVTETPPGEAPATPPADDPTKNYLPVVHNQMEPATLNTQQSALKNAITNIQEQVVVSVINRVTRNAYDQQSDVIDDQDRQDFEQELVLALAAFYGVIVPLYARQVLSRRMTEFSKLGTFTMGKDVRQYIAGVAGKAAASHMTTILEDLRGAVKAAAVAEGDTTAIEEAVKKTYPQATSDDIKAAVKTAAKGGKPDAEIAAAIQERYKDASFEELLAGVRKSALEGATHPELISAIRSEYTQITKVRAETIAKTETSRAFSTAQFQADTQFLAQNELTHRAFKKWICRGPNPCVFCLAKQAEPAIPFAQAFVKIGDTVKATSTTEDGKTKVHAYSVTYEDVFAGDIHPNGNCSYQLIVE